MHFSLAKLLVRSWSSPTITSWASQGSRALSIFIILPLLLTKLDTIEIALWFLFATIMGLQLLADSGFSATFSRVIAYSMGGAKEIIVLKNPEFKIGSDSPNFDLLANILGTMRKVYFLLGILWLVLLASIGTWVVSDLAAQLENPDYAWLAWVIVVVTSSIRLVGAGFGAYIIGINEIPVLRRWEAIVWLAMIPANLLVLSLDGGLLGIVATTQLFVVVDVLIKWILSKTVKQGLKNKLPRCERENDVFARVWPAAWRSGLGVLMITGLVQLTGIVYAKIGSAAEVASYLFALNMIRVLSQFSQAPFYSKLPLLARIRAEGDLARQQMLAERGMKISFWVLVSGLTVIGLAGEYFVKIIGSNVDFVKVNIWALMGVALFLERYGAMHLQLYSTTNHILWHIANGVTGIIYLVIVAPLYLLLGLAAFPASQIISNLLFYDWFSANKSYAAFKLNFLQFEKKTSLFPLLFLIIFSVLLGITSNPGL